MRTRSLFLALLLCLNGLFAGASQAQDYLSALWPPALTNRGPSHRLVRVPFS